MARQIKYLVDFPVLIGKVSPDSSKERKRQMPSLTPRQEPRQEPQQIPRPTIGQSQVMKQMVAFAKAVAPLNTTVLLLGERGVGKDHMAKMIHSMHERSGNFVTVDCGALPESLIETELFGHAKGAFTGAEGTKKGLVECAEGGTLFLNEIGEVPIRQQSMYLRLVEEKTYRVVGTIKEIPINTRLIAATNVKVDEAIASGKLRGDLYDRLDQLTFRVPPLREHREDIPHLANYFLRKNTESHQFSIKAFDIMMDYHWPGNVRQLGNVVKKISLDLILKPDGGELVEARRVEPYLTGTDREKPLDSVDTGEVGEKTFSTLRETDVRYLREILKKTRGNIIKAAKIAEVKNRAMYHKIREFQLRDFAKSLRES